jgi:hypothetical protein
LTEQRPKKEKKRKEGEGISLAASLGRSLTHLPLWANPLGEKGKGEGGSRGRIVNRQLRIVGGGSWGEEN